MNYKKMMEEILQEDISAKITKALKKMFGDKAVTIVTAWLKQNNASITDVNKWYAYLKDIDGTDELLKWFKANKTKAFIDVALSESLITESIKLPTKEISEKEYIKFLNDLKKEGKELAEDEILGQIYSYVEEQFKKKEFQHIVKYVYDNNDIKIKSSFYVAGVIVDDMQTQNII